MEDGTLDKIVQKIADGTIVLTAALTTGGIFGGTLSAGWLAGYCVNYAIQTKDLSERVGSGVVAVVMLPVIVSLAVATYCTGKITYDFFEDFYK